MKKTVIAFFFLPSRKKSSIVNGNGSLLSMVECVALADGPHPAVSAVFIKQQDRGPGLSFTEGSYGVVLGMLNS